MLHQDTKTASSEEEQKAPKSEQKAEEKNSDGNMKIRDVEVREGIAYYIIYLQTEKSAWVVQKRVTPKIARAQREEVAISSVETLQISHKSHKTSLHRSCVVTKLKEKLREQKNLHKELGHHPLIFEFFKSDICTKAFSKSPDKNDDKNRKVSASNEEPSTRSEQNGSKTHNKLSESFDFPQDQEVFYLCLHLLQIRVHSFSPFFLKKKKKKNCSVTNVKISSVRKLSDHVLYKIQVSNENNRSSYGSWTVLKRFIQFCDMHNELRRKLLGDCQTLQEREAMIHQLNQLPSLPPKRIKVIYNHSDDSFIEERRVLLENYLKKMLRFPGVANNKIFLEFLGVS
ncbi:hypothetical protein RFI_32649 [Reticulomyxa filosa]|uniref:PX domain-containing protein n=1 Tax=Reticulomyxa filosa TaxID=46433 RepID=X6LUD0_RETFI|nr:hypothetical protein RFI_32649 [Reticulomyxa filosa]|eukprot:ETO04747.1 hypothetical protein RFI_32649 [Reticulomyxa filosa]